MSDLTQLSAAVSPNEMVVTLLDPLPASSGYIVVDQGLPTEERMKILSVDETGRVVRVERDKPKAHMLASYVMPAPPLCGIESEPWDECTPMYCQKLQGHSGLHAYTAEWDDYGRFADESD